MSSQIKVALVGASGYGDTYLQSLLGAPANSGVTFVGVADPEPGRCKWKEQLGRAGIPFYRSLEEMLPFVEDLDLLMLSTPIHLHAPHACLAASMGINVLCEKPLAGSFVDANRMLAAERKGPGFIAIGFQWSFSAAIQNLKADILAGRLGRPKSLRTLVSFPRPGSYYGRNNWAGRLETPGGQAILDNPVNNAAAHYLHNMLWVLGASPELSAMPETVSAELYRANRIETYDTAALRLVAGGTEMLFLTTHAARERIGPIFQFDFEDAVVSYDPAISQDVVARYSDGREVNYGDPNHDRNEKIWHCIDAIRNGEAPICTVRSALPHTLSVLAAQRVPVCEMGPASLETYAAGDDVMIGVRDLGPALLECLAKNVLPSELGGLAWATAPRTVNVGEGRVGEAVPHANNGAAAPRSGAAKPVSV